MSNSVRICLEEKTIAKSMQYFGPKSIAVSLQYFRKKYCSTFCNTFFAV